MKHVFLHGWARRTTLLLLLLLTGAFVSLGAFTGPRQVTRFGSPPPRRILRRGGADVVGQTELLGPAELDDMYPDLGPKEAAVLDLGPTWAVLYNPSGTAAHWSRELMQQSKQAEGLSLIGRAKTTLRQKLHLIGRLDRTVSGLSLLARDPETACVLGGANISKVYYALCRNSGEEYLNRGPFWIDRPLQDKRPFGRSRKENLKPSLTEAEVLFGSKDPDCCLVRVAPRTGRYHQIRRHLRNISFPILGDQYYERATRQYFESHGVKLPRRVLLHLHSITVPETGKTPRIHVTCPFPPNMVQLIRDSFPAWASEAEEKLPELFASPPARRNLPEPPQQAPKRTKANPPRKPGLWKQLKTKVIGWFHSWRPRRRAPSFAKRW
ncbi:Ribosomal large subunit pseudouridine synthase D [Symbiodinium microadriaticum]|uniref:Ribosomal large subunit pseudouridine synthase D n=1 Tax=Symbiodinium microadriaticum TaxID=2951 RepID=A0A1Q9EDS9_SYMMI|nr:Ribosomal large subunit pseudouridine synthase D [Symbiodinium microadriaticum]